MAEDFIADGALTGDDERIVVRVDERQPRFGDERVAMRLRVIVAVTGSLTSAPKPRTASTLICGVVCGMTMVACSPSLRAENATPWA